MIPRSSAGAARALALGIVLLIALAASSAGAHDDPAELAGSAERRAMRTELAALTDALRQSAVSAEPVVAADGGSLAERRRDLLSQLAAHDPAAALSFALSPAERAALPPSVQALAEEWVTREGRLEVVHADQPDGTGFAEVALVSGRQRIPLRLTAASRATKPGDEVRVRGIALQDAPIVVADQVITLQSAAAPSALGPQRTAIILASSPGAPPHPYANKASTASVFYSASSGQSLRAYYEISSYGQMIVEGANGEGTAADVYGPYTINPAPCSPTGPSGMFNLAVTAADVDIDYNRYDRVMILWNYPPGCNFAGIAGVGSWSFGPFDGASQRLSVGLVVNSAFGSTQLGGKVGGSTVHEYGHNLGMFHAYTLDCGGQAITPLGCTRSEYNDPAEVMGRSAGYGDINAVHKEQLGWLGGGRLQTATMGSYALEPIESQGSGLKVLKVPRTSSAGNVLNYYYLEYRQPPTSWRVFADLRPRFTSGVVVHTAEPDPASGTGTTSFLIDTTPNSLTGTSTLSSTPSDWDDAPIASGRTYTDAGGQVSIAVSSMSTAGVRVDITAAVGNTPTPTATTQVRPTSTPRPTTPTSTARPGTATTAPPSPSPTVSPTATIAIPGGSGIVAVPNAVSAGDTITVAWAGLPSPGASDWIALVPVDAPDRSRLDWLYVTCTRYGSTPQPSGACQFQAPATPGTYQFRLFSNNTYALKLTSNSVIVGAGVTMTPTVTRTPRPASPTATPTPTRTPFTVAGPPGLTVSPANPPPGTTVTVSWSGVATPNGADWIALYPIGAVDQAYMDWSYVSCTRFNSARWEALPTGSCSFRLPTRAGTYEFRLFARNQFALLATSAPAIASDRVDSDVDPWATAAGATADRPSASPTRRPSISLTATPTTTATHRPPSATSTHISPSATATATATPVPPTATATATPVPPTATATPVPPTATATRAPPSLTATHSPPTATLTPTHVPPTATSTRGLATPTRPARAASAVSPRIAWQPRAVTQALAPGEAATLAVELTTTRSIDAPRFRVSTRAGTVAIDPSSIPGRLEPGVSYELRLTVRALAGRAGRIGQTATVALLAPDGRALTSQLIVRLPARRGG